MALDLSALEEKPSVVSVAAEPAGKPLDISVADIEEDPDQPRKEFSAEAMREMTESIRLRGVKTPISVRTHPTKPKKWMLNYGARRFRGTLAAGRATIPAFIDEAHDDYDQVIENLQRDDLKPMELALFIKKRLDAGDRKKTIAENLGKDSAVITQHLALIDPPACVEAAYSSGKCSSPKTLYELRGLHEKFPEEVEAWCASVPEITRRTVSELAEALKAGNKPGVPSEVRGSQGADGDAKANAGQPPEADKAPGSGNENGIEGCSEGERAAAESRDPEPHQGVSRSGSGNSEGDPGMDQGEPASWPRDRAVSGPDRISRPLMLVEFKGRAAAVLLNRRPSSPGLIHIRFEDGQGDMEVSVSACRIKLLTEARK
jgi:ParB family chromosome partitioning protein